MRTDRYNPCNDEKRTDLPFNQEAAVRAVTESLLRIESDTHVAIGNGALPSEAAEQGRVAMACTFNDALEHAFAAGKRSGFDAGNIGCDEAYNDGLADARDALLDAQSDAALAVIGGLVRDGS